MYYEDGGGIKDYISDGEAIEIIVTPKEGVTADDLDNYRFSLEYCRDSKMDVESAWNIYDFSEKLVPGESLNLEISQTFVELAERDKEPFTIYVKCERRKVDIVLDNLGGKVKYYEYEPVKTDEEGIYVSGDKKGSEIKKPITIDKGSDFCSQS